MTIKSNESTEKDESCETFIHMLDLPWLAYSKDVRGFFHGLSVKKNGVLLRQYEAFVAFEDPRDVHTAICRKNRTILGSQVRLSVIDKSQLRQALFRIAKRRLDFKEDDGISRDLRVKIDAPTRKKIRPTPVLSAGEKKGDARCLTFCPEESDIPPTQYVTDVKITLRCSRSNRYRYAKRKIQPMRVSDADDSENFVVFHPAECFEAKKMKLDIQ